MERIDIKKIRIGDCLMAFNRSLLKWAMIEVIQIKKNTITLKYVVGNLEKNEICYYVKQGILSKVYKNKFRACQVNMVD